MENRATLIKDAEQATQKRNEVFRQLNDWWLNYRRILTHIFQDDPQRLEEFNITAYSDGYKPNKKKKTDNGEGNQEGEGEEESQKKENGNQNNSNNNKNQQNGTNDTQDNSKSTGSDKNEKNK